MTRRELFEAVSAFALAAIAPATSSAQQRSSDLRLTALGDDLAVVTGAGGNILIHMTDSGLTLIDSGLRSRISTVRSVVKTYWPIPIVTLINTHWHYDHTGGNTSLGSAGARIIAHENCLLRLSTAQYMPFQGVTVEPLPAAGLPTEVFKTSGSLSAGTETLHYVGMPPAHTDGDITVRCERANVLHCGDLFFNGIYPFIDYASGGSVEGMIRNAETILAGVDGATTLIPGHGPVGTKPELAAFRDMLAGVNANIAALKRQGRTLEQTQAAKPTAAWDATWGGGGYRGADLVKMIYLGPDILKPAEGRTKPA